MGMKDLILSRQNRPLTVIRSGAPNATNESGMQKDDPASPNGLVIYGRLTPSNARQMVAYQSAYGVLCDWELVSLDGTLQNGDRLQDADGRTFQVEGMPNKRIGMGTLPTYYKYPLSSTLFQGPII